MHAGLNRLIVDTDASVLLVTGVGHGAPANLANQWVDGTLTEVYPELGRDHDGMARLIRTFSWPGGLPSHLSPLHPGVIHEGGELGYALAKSFGAAFDNPDLIVACIVGDGEFETGPTATAWHSTKFLNPAHDGAVLPLLHRNGYKIANPTVPGTMSDSELRKLFEGYGWHPLFVEGDDESGDGLDASLAAALDDAYADPHDPGRRPWRPSPARPPWPVIVVTSPKGWTGIKELDGLPIEGTWRGAPGARRRLRDQSRAPRGGRDVAALVRGRRAARPHRVAGSRDPRPLPRRRAPHGLQPARARRTDPRAAPVAVARGRRSDTRRARRDERERAGSRGHLPGRRHQRQRGGAELPDRLPRRAGLQQARRGARRDDARRTSGRCVRSTSTTVATDACSRCCRSTTARAGSRATSSPAATGCSRATRRSPRS